MFFNYKVIFQILLLLFLFFIDQSVYSQENQKNIYNKKSTLAATLLGFIPGAGHFYLGDYKTGGKFVATTGLLLAYENYLRNNTKIIKKTDIAFNPELTLFMNELEERNYLYQTEEEFQENPLTRLLFGLELEKEREFRLLKNGQYFPFGILDGAYDLYFYEINPLIKYGNYSRRNKETVFYRKVRNGFIIDSFYSSYAAYRDSGAYENSSRQEETFSEVVTSPFRWSYFKDWQVTVPILINILVFSSVFGGDSKYIVPPGEKNYLLFFSIMQYLKDAAIWEESFFRGTIDHSLSKQIGNTPALLTSAFLFGIVHPYPQQKVAAFIFGSYLSWISRKYNYDIKPAIFIHFWVNFIASLVDSQKNIVESNYAELNNLQVHSMPVVFYTKTF